VERPGDRRLHRHERSEGEASDQPCWARYFDFGSGRLPAFLQELMGSGGA
jgi:hypothetical protein